MNKEWSIEILAKALNMYCNLCIKTQTQHNNIQIKLLKSRAGSGDEMTLALVRDLQDQLLHFERQLVTKATDSRSDPDSGMVLLKLKQNTLLKYIVA